MPHDESSPNAMESLSNDIAALADVLLPGGDGWLSGSMAGIQHSILMRLLDKGGQQALERLAGALAESGAPLATRTPDERLETVRRLEALAGDLFSWLKSTAFYAYYENPVVVAKVASSGTPYQMSPHQHGYNLPKFDLATQTPRHGRGVWIRSEEVCKLDPSTLGLEKNSTEKWGVQR